MSKRYKLVCFDLDGTLIDNTVFIWQTLHDYFKTDTKKRQKYKDDFYAGKITYSEWFFSDLELLKEVGATKDKMIALFEKIKVVSGSKETLSYLKKNGYKLAVISGSIDILLKTKFPEIDFDYVLINKLFFDGKGEIIGGEPTNFDLENKAKGLIYIVEREGIDLQETVFVGDNYNDIEVAKIAGLSLSFNSKSAAFDTVCDIIIKEKDLRSILPYIEGDEEKHR